MPDVSVVMSTYKENPNYVEEAINSILSQTYRNLELIIIVDWPENEPVKRLLYRRQAKDRRIVIVENEHNLGLANSLNKALKIAKGDYICRMDADDVSEPARIETQLAYLLKYKLDLVGGSMVVMDETGKDLYAIPQPPMEPKFVEKALRWNNCVPHPTWLGTKSVFASGYRNIPLCEDYDFLIRASLSRKKIGNCDSVVLRYRMTSDSISRSSLYRQYLYQVFITRAYANDSFANLEEAKKYVDARDTREKADRYAKANAIFNQTLSLIKSRRFAQSTKYTFRLLFTSKAYLNKILRLSISSILSFCCIKMNKQ